MQNEILAFSKKDSGQIIDLLDHLAAEFGHGENEFRVMYFTAHGNIINCPFDTVFLSDAGLANLQQHLEKISWNQETTVWA